MIYGADCETDPFLNGRIPEPFLWGIYGDFGYKQFEHVKDFLDFVGALEKNSIIYFHNGGKFDIHFLLPFLDRTKAKIINGRIVKITYKSIQFRDSFACAPAPLSATGDKKEIEYYKLEKGFRLKHWIEISEYLKADCKALYELMKRYHEKVGDKITVASNALYFATEKLDISVKKTTRLFDEKFREYYFGGRVEARQSGEFKNIYIYDIKSAYPTAMLHDHPHGNKYSEGAGYIKDADFFIVRCYARNCFPKKIKGKLEFPSGFDTYFATSWEFNAAKELNLISAVSVLKSIKFHNKINFSDYVLHWYEEKEKAEKEGNKRDRLISKFLLNSLYGKMAQDPLNFDEYQFKAPGDKIDTKNGWQLSHALECYNGEVIEIHKRPMLNAYEEKYDDWKKENLYYNVATGASITGYVRAMLIKAIHETGDKNIIYCDTDSISSKVPLNKKFLGEKLGDWSFEGLATRKIICGKKLYGIQWENGKQKVSSKGSKLSFEEIERINQGEVIHWKNDAPTFSLSRGIVFIDRKIQKTV